jgi:hypothetical protein
MSLVIGLLLIAASAAFYWASRNLNVGVHWAEETRRQAGFFCQGPYGLLVAGGVLLGFAISRGAFKA